MKDDISYIMQPRPDDKGSCILAMVDNDLVASILNLFSSATLHTIFFCVQCCVMLEIKKTKNI